MTNNYKSQAQLSRGSNITIEAAKLHQYAIDEDVSFYHLFRLILVQTKFCR